jgi:hypothetical protein
MNNQRNKNVEQSQHPTGPTSVRGVEANDLPNGGRGSVETEPGHELDRHLPQNTGEVAGSDINNDVGMAGDPEIREADDERTLGRHQGDK